MNTEQEDKDMEKETSEEEEKEDGPAEMATSDHEEEHAEGKKASEEEPCDEEGVIREPEMLGADEIPGASDDKKMNEVHERQLIREESVVFENNSSCDDGNPRLHLETPDRDTASPAQEEEEEEEVEVEEEEEEEEEAAADNEVDINYEECMRLLQELSEQRDQASQRNSQLQEKLAEYFSKKAKDGIQLEDEMPVTAQLQEYEQCISAMVEMKQQLDVDSEKARQQAEEFRLDSQEKLDKVENEWRALLALKRDVAVMALSRRLGKEAAQAKVKSVLTAEQHRQEELIKQRLKYFKLTIKICRLEAELREEEESDKDPLQIQFDQLQAERLEKRKHDEKESEELSKVQKKINSCLELLSNVKEKLYWGQMDVQAKEEQLAEVEAILTKKRELLTRTKQVRNNLQRDNLRLKERRGLLGNMALLRDFEDTVDASDHLEERLENLKCPQAEFAFSCGRWKKKLEKEYE